MRCKLIRDDMEVNCADPKQIDGQVVVKRVRRSGRMVDRKFWKKGAVLSHPDAYRLVQQGCAIPEDVECQKAANMSTEGMAAAQHAYGRLVAGIHIDDFAAYDSGYLGGYEPDGSWKPGPNGGRAEYEALFDEPEDEDDDDE